MRPDQTDELPGFPLWDFSLRIYGRPGVATAALALQDEAGLDVNLLLLCLWAAAEGPGRLSGAEVSGCMEGVARWQQAVVQPLRTLRRGLKTAALDVHDLHTRVVAAELAAEHAEQRQLALLVRRSAGPAVRDAGADAAANLDTYLACAGVAGQSRLQPHIAVLLHAVTTRASAR